MPKRTADPLDADPPLTGRGAWLVLGALLIPTLPNAIYFFASDHAWYWLWQWVTSVLIVLSPFLFGCSVRTGLALFLPFAAVIPLFAAYAWATGYPPSLLALQMLREASRQELSTYLFHIIALLASSAAILACYASLIWKLGSFRVPIPRGIRAAGITLLVFFLLRDCLTHGWHDGKDLLRARLRQMQPVAPVALTIQRESDGGLVPDRRKLLAAHQVTQEPALPGREVCVLVVGESARDDAFGLYSPALATTPLLQARKDLMVFHNARSCGTATIQAVPILMTGRFPEAGEVLPFHHLDLIDAFRLAGFRTEWLSMQAADAEPYSFISAFLINADQKLVLAGTPEGSASSAAAPQYDEALLEPLEKALQAPGKTFLVLHMMGSHFPYSKRYPAAFEHWPVSPAARSGMNLWIPPYDTLQRHQLENAYLDTIFYTDWFLNEVIRRLEATGGVSSMVFLSDHGENHSDDPIMPSGHAVLTADVIHIPFLVWTSAEFQRQRPGKIQKLRENLSQPVSSEDVFSTVCGLSDLRTAEAPASKDLTSGDYRSRPRRVLLLDDEIVQTP